MSSPEYSDFCPKQKKLVLSKVSFPTWHQIQEDQQTTLVAFGLPVPVDTRASENTALAPSSANRGNAANMAMSAVANAYALRFFLDKQMDLRI